MHKSNILDSLNGLINNVLSQESICKTSTDNDERIAKLKRLLLEMEDLDISSFTSDPTNENFELIDSSNHYDMF